MEQGYIVVNFKWMKSHVAAIEMKPGRTFTTTKTALSKLLNKHDNASALYFTFIRILQKDIILEF